MKPRTVQELEKEVHALEALKPRVRRFSKFGDDNHAAIDAQIKVFREDLSEEDIYKEWEDPDNYDANRYLIDSALVAAAWRDGESEDGLAPSDDWKPLVGG